jgi:hypothetical protein
MDCYALERSSPSPLGKDLAVECYALERSSSGPLGKDLLACPKKWAAVDDVEVAGDVSVLEMGSLGRFLIYLKSGFFGLVCIALIWAEFPLLG